jgi:hypothetical protein
MADDISKLCSDFLRNTYPGLKASHARELVAAFFGYKSHASLLAETRYSVDEIGEAEVLVPDVKLMEQRRACLNGLPSDLSESRWLAEEIGEFLSEEGYFSGEIWACDSDLATYMLEDYLPNNVDGDLDNYLSVEIAGTNAYFDEPYYDTANVEHLADMVKVTVPGQYNGSHDFESDRMFSGDTIDMVIVVELPRVAGHVGFAKPEVEVTGEVNTDYYDDVRDEEAISAKK